MSIAKKTSLWSLWSLAGLHIRRHRTVYSLLATLWTGLVAYDLYRNCLEQTRVSTYSSCGTCLMEASQVLFVEGPCWLLTSIACCMFIRLQSSPLHKIARCCMVASGAILFAPIGTVLFSQFIER